jgi:hypothetical protein
MGMTYTNDNDPEGYELMMLLLSFSVVRHVQRMVKRFKQGGKQ